MCFGKGYKWDVGNNKLGNLNKPMNTTGEKKKKQIIIIGEHIDKQYKSQCIRKQKIQDLFCKCHNIINV